MGVSKKTTKNSEWPGRQERPGIEPGGTFRLPALSTEPIHHWWGTGSKDKLQLDNDGYISKN